MILMTSGLNIEGQPLWLLCWSAPLVFNGRAGSGASESVYRGGCYPYVSWHTAYTAMISAVKISQLGYSEP